VFLPQLIIKRDSEAAVAGIGATILSTSQRDDGSHAVKVSVSKQFAIALHNKEHPDVKLPEAKAVGALIVRHIAALIISHLQSSIEAARAAVDSEPPPPGDGRLHACTRRCCSG
jgi:hypothetical protein